jgi:hypothetical protein
MSIQLRPFNPQAVHEQSIPSFVEFLTLIETSQWYNDKIHRVRPATKYASITKEWYWNGQLHRSDLPAIECATSGIKEWFIHGKFIK